MNFLVSTECFLSHSFREIPSLRAMDQATFDRRNYDIHYDADAQQGVPSQQISSNDTQLQSNSCYQVTNIGQTRE